MPVPQTHNQLQKLLQKAKNKRSVLHSTQEFLTAKVKLQGGSFQKKIKLKNIKGAGRIAFTSNHCNFTSNSSEGMKVTDFLVG
jgi:hypothetical protein